MFKKSSKLNIRKRRDTDDDHEDQENGEVQNAVNKIPINTVASASSNSKKEKPKKTKEGKKVSLLSFGDAEEDGNVFQLKKSSRSRRIAKQIKKRSQEEKESQNNNTSIKNNKNEFKQAASKDVHVFQSQKDKKNTSQTKETELVSKVNTDLSFSSLNSGAIPTPSMIHAARKQREMLRKFGSEYISLKDTSKDNETSQSRLIRDDDNDSSDDGIMEMRGIEKDSSQTIKKFVPNESDDEVDEEEEEANADEEVHRWEEEMIKKGINLQTSQPTQLFNQGTALGNSSHSGSYAYGYADSYYNSQAQYSGSNLPSRHVEAKSDLTLASVKKRLQDRMASMDEKSRSHLMEMDSLVFDSSESEQMSKNLDDIKQVSEEYQFYQEMRDYIKDLVGCLRENVPVINSLEQNAHLLWKNHSQRLIARRRQDVQDESTQVSLASKPAQDKNNIDSGYVERVREREARRTRRRAARQIKQTQSTHYDGTSTDDEQTSMDQAQHSSEFERIQSSCRTVFDDVIEDFCVLEKILERFDNWRDRGYESYNDAYIALCIPKLVIPFIRLRMVLWNPLLPSASHFEEEDWFKELSVFGLKNFTTDGCDVGSNVMDDTRVVSSVIEKVLVVKLVFFAQSVWDPLSTKQTVRLTLLIKELIRDYAFMNADTNHCQKLIQVLCKRLQTALDNDIFIPLLPPSSASSPGYIFLERQTWTCIKLFKNALMLDGVLSYKVLCELAFDSLLNRYILLALQTSVLNVSCLYKCQRIIDSIPKTWFREKENISSYLSSLARFLVHFAKSVQASDQIASKTLVKQIKSMLLVIGARDALLQL